ncbi:CorA family divalent cation transporter [Paracoccus cavernae]|uniref:CorA family divalent cation transporter n=2 Tax=Paracoccus cavernae TaxID=1571207 RepID=A0ABT8D257_9RHOB|nr:CorA family divalent cation transporter [Paracoccus cavernae]
MADLLEGVGRELDHVSGTLLGNTEPLAEEALRASLLATGRSAAQISRVRLCLMTVERMLVFHIPNIEKRSEAGKLRATITATQLDIHALHVHAEFLEGRITLTVDATMGMINLRQNVTVKILSVVAALFLPPTLIASTYGMNFRLMPELEWSFGYPLAVGLMVASSVATFLIFRWKKWL